MLAVIIPTRNRADLAIASVHSILRSKASSQIRILVSDNSTNEAESAQLREFVSGLGDRVHLARPATSLGMTAHWNFAIEHAMDWRECTHFTVLTDRMLYKTGGLDAILAAYERWPADVISFTYDRVQDYEAPITYRPLPRSFETFRITSSDLLAMSARMSIPSCLPRMLNCVSPREHLEKLKNAQGAVFQSIAPDYNFCYSTLISVPSIVYMDRSLLVNHAQGRSNGASFARGVMSTDSKDFLATSIQGGVNHHSPIPGVYTVGNAVIHEYMVAKLGPGGDVLPAIQRDRYLEFLALEVTAFVDSAQAAAALELLRANGWKPTWKSFLGKIRTWVEGRILGLRQRTFYDHDQAIAYALSDVTRNWRWFPHPARRYGQRIDR
jgi:glycosyltransferase involved in cell wall biosynthesis